MALSGFLDSLELVSFTAKTLLDQSESRLTSRSVHVLNAGHYETRLNATEGVLKALFEVWLVMKMEKKEVKSIKNESKFTGRREKLCNH